MLFSVLVPMYNVEMYAMQCIESIETQTFSDYELIIVDDGSTDSTVAILDEAKDKYSNITVIHKENGGLTSARKAAALKASGKYIIIVDGDDYIDKLCLEKFAKVIKKYNHPDMVIGGYKRVSKSGNVHIMSSNSLGIEGYLTNGDLEAKVYHNLFSINTNICSKAIKRELYLDVQLKMSDAISMGEDGCIIYPTLVKSKDICFINDSLYCYRYNSNSLTNTRKKYVPWNHCLWRIHFLEDNLPIDKHNLRYQLSKYVIHACFTVVRTQLKADDYESVTKFASSIMLSEEINCYFCMDSNYLSIKEKIMKFLLKNRLYIFIKLFF